MSTSPAVRNRHAVTLSALGVAAALLAATPVSGEPALVAAFGPAGLSSLKYGGIELLATGAPGVSSVTFETMTRDADGIDKQAYEKASLDGGTTRFDANRRRYVHDYAWGSVAFEYVPAPDRLGVAVHLENKSAKPIVNFSLRPAELRFPAAPEGWAKPQRRVERSLDHVVAVSAVYGPHKVLACLDTVFPPMALGFGKPLDEAKTLYEVELHGGVPVSDRESARIHPLGLTRIEPGKTSTFRFSLRFAPAARPDAELVADLYELFRVLYPPLNDWPDRRPIGMLMLHSGNKSAKNPRGWFKEPDMDTATPGGKLKFKQLLTDYADRAIKSMQALDAQGGIVWNVEGEENPHPITYIGDPRMLKTLAPEMDEVADGFFKRFRDAGFRTGVTIRPTQIYMKGDKWNHGTGSHGPERNPLGESYDGVWPEGLPWWEFFPVVERMCRKIAYAKERWGCTIFYIDTNGMHCPLGEDKAFTWLLLDGHMLRRIKERHPDVLLIPELSRGQVAFHATNWGYGAQYMEIDMGGFGTPAAVRALYPGAFSVVNIADGPIDEKRDVLIESVKHGDILMTRGWFGDSRNQKVVEIYEAAGKPLKVR